MDGPGPAGYNAGVKTAESKPATALSPGLRRYLYFTATITGAAILIVEILGARMLAPYIGTSHFVWTAQIGVTLVALAAGYAAGGWLADRSRGLSTVYWGMVVAALWLCGAVQAGESVAYAALRLPLPAASLLTSLALYFVPLAALAMVGPFFIRALTDRLGDVGSNTGRLSSVSTLGSVLGTALVGYVLIPYFSNSATMVVTAAALVLAAVVYFVVWGREGAFAGMLAAGAGAALGYGAARNEPLQNIPGLRELHRTNSNFGLMQVVETADGSRRFYLNNLLMQNSYDPATRQSVSVFTHLLHGLARAYHPEIRSVFCIGMGVGIVPQQFAREGAAVEVVEINPAVVPLAERFFGFEPGRVRLHLADGRWFAAVQTNQYDAVILDAFLGESPPAHLMTREAFAVLRQRLRPGGVLVMNSFGDTGRRDFLTASITRTLQAVFRSVRVHGAGLGNVFLVASDQPDLQFRRAPEVQAFHPSVRAEAREILEGRFEPVSGDGLVLTDDFNPVDFHEAATRENLRKRLAAAYRPDGR